MPLRTIHLRFVVLLSCSCAPLKVDLSGRECLDGECTPGFECYELTNTCVPAISRGCHGDAVCWSAVAEGGPCAVSGSFVACGPWESCVGGCRTCEDGAWSECRAPPCEVDADVDGVCDTIDTCVDDDVDGLGNGHAGNTGCAHGAVDSDDSDPTVCADTDADGCDDCMASHFDPLADGDDDDGDGACNAGDDDDDGDTVDDAEDVAPRDPTRCRDLDGDDCDDCSAGSGPDPANDGADTDSDGACDLDDIDDDNDGVIDAADPTDDDPTLCGDQDLDGCDDCAVGVDGFGPAVDRDPANDGTDGDSDGWCTQSDCRDDRADVHPGAAEGPVGAPTCADGIDNDCDGDADVDERGCWLDPSWTRRKRLQVESEYVRGAHGQFPVLVSRTDADLAASARGDGADIRFTAADGATALPYEIERYDPASGELIAWVRVGGVSSSADTPFYLYYGGATAASGNAAVVWDDEFVAIWHLDDDPASTAPQIADSNDGLRHMRAIGGMTTSDNVAARIGRGIDLDGSDDYLRSPDLASDFASTTYTLEMWVFPRTDGVIIDELGQATPDTGWHDSQIEILSDATVWVRVWPVAAVQLGQASFGAWHHVVLRYDAATTTLDGFLDGVETADEVIDDRLAPHIWDDSYQQRWTVGSADGTDLGSGNWLDGVADEVRLSRVARSADWIATGYLNQAQPQSFVTFGNEETY